METNTPQAPAVAFEVVTMQNGMSFVRLTPDLAHPRMVALAQRCARLDSILTVPALLGSPGSAYAAGAGEFSRAWGQHYGSVMAPTEADLWAWLDSTLTGVEQHRAAYAAAQPQRDLAAQQREARAVKALARIEGNYVSVQTCYSCGLPYRVHSSAWLTVAEAREFWQDERFKFEAVRGGHCGC